MPRKKYVPTQRDRGIVKALASYGIPQEDIGRVVGCSHVTLRKAYERELAVAAIEANAKAAEVLFANVQNPDPRYQASRFFWLKTRAKWRETSNLSLVDPQDDSKPLDIASVREYVRNSPSDES